MRPTKTNSAEERRVRHLINAIDSGSRVERLGRTTVVASPVLAQPQVESVLEVVERMRITLEEKLEPIVTGLISCRPHLTIGLFPEQSSFANYLTSECMGGLAGSRGATHPVRLVSCVIAADEPLLRVDHREVVAHESVHLWALKSGLCPSWHAWPRWLHEGLAMLWDHTSVGDSESSADSVVMKPNGGGYERDLPLNPARLADWLRVGRTFDLESFMRKDAIRNRKPHSEDYAASWVLTYALMKWKNGETLRDLWHELLMRNLESFDGKPIEPHVLRWAKDRFGSEWPVFSAFVREIGRK